ncbi:MAG: hypothetical protein KGI54_08175 [Pseudomonadota bacterium]|nr:hypothetical protein [Pseudomonadota bacterium]
MAYCHEYEENLEDFSQFYLHYVAGNRFAKPIKETFYTPNEIPDIAYNLNYEACKFETDSLDMCMFEILDMLKAN